MSIITRGNFLKLSLSALAGLLLANLIACVNKSNIANIIKNPAVTGKSESSEESGNSTETQIQNKTTSTTTTNTTTTSSQEKNIEKKAIVGIAGGNNKVSALVGKAIELAGGLSFINKGSTVLIKPNLNTGDPYPASTNPEVVYEVINLVKKQDPYRILVGDRSGYWLNTIDCMKKSKIYDAAIDAGAEIYPFDDEEWVKVNPKMAQNWENGFRIPKIVNDVDYIISIPVLKTHIKAYFSIAIKNWVGILHPKDRTSGLHSYEGNKTVFGYKLAELHLSRLPSFIVTDCTKVFVDGGPTTGKAIDANLIYATNDIIANDVVGLAILKTLGTIEKIQRSSPWDQYQIKRAVELGLGIKEFQKITINPYLIDYLDTILNYIK